LFNLSLSFQGGVTNACVFIAMAHYLSGRKLIYHLSNTPNTSLTALISGTSRDTRSFAANTPNILPKRINFFTPSLSMACRVLITADHSPWVVESATPTATAPATSTATSQQQHPQRHRNNSSGSRQRAAAVATRGSVLRDITNFLNV